MESSTNNQATTIFVLGLLSPVFCALCGPVAWIMGNNYVRDCQMEGIQPDGLGVAGRIMGIIGTIMLTLSLGIFVLYIGVIFMAIAAGGL